MKNPYDHDWPSENAGVSEFRAFLVSGLPSHKQRMGRAVADLGREVLVGSKTFIVYPTIGRHLATADIASPDLELQVVNLSERDPSSLGRVGDLAPMGRYTNDPDLDQAEAEFQRLADLWIEDTRFSSSWADRFLHDAYQDIIGLGPAAIGPLLRRLHDEPIRWFWALEHTTRSRPVPDGAAIEEAVHIWEDWGLTHGFLP